MKARSLFACLATISALLAVTDAAAVAQRYSAAVDPKKAQITILYDAFGKQSTLQKDWGFSAFIEYGGKRILFDTGNNADIFAHNVKGKHIDLTKLDFAVISHRHGDHTSGLNHLLSVNPKVRIYAPKENFGVFSSVIPGTFYRRNDALPAEMRYFDGKAPETLRAGTPWPKANFTLVEQSMEISPGLRLIMLKGSWGVDLDVMEISLAIDTPEGTILVVGCSHPTIEKIVEATKAATNKPVHLVVGGTHLLPAKDDEIQRIATSLHDNFQVAWIAPAHCTGEPAFAILKKTFGDRYLYAGLGTTLTVGATITAMNESGQPTTKSMDRNELRTYRALLATAHDYAEEMVASK